MIRGFILCLTGAILVAGCATVPQGDSVDEYRQTIDRLFARITANPSDAESQREIGVIYFEVKRYDRAAKYLGKALELNPNDAKALFYLGMSHEFLGDKNAALARYINYSSLSSSSPYRKVMEGRYEGLVREIIRDQFRSLVAGEDTIGVQKLTQKTVAVLPFSYQSGDPKFAPLGYGMSEMIAVDLGHVSQLKLVERTRVEELLKELKLGTTDAVDPATAPRMGKLLAAGSMVSGALAVTADQELRVDVSSIDVATSVQGDTRSQSDDLENLFMLEKDIVFKVVADFGIVLSKEEREKIEGDPTKSLQAFLAYSMGLEREAFGDIDAASVMYNEAVRIDPSFAPARTRRDGAEARRVSGTRDLALGAAKKVDPGPEPDRSGKSLARSRLDNLQAGIGSGFVPGMDSRKPAEIAREGVLGTPPRPPSP